ncbi:helix-turn-helix domain-containing protein [Marinobacter sp. M1N3S26]|uniref:helix-turn-helix domain-containing protein n=1 Tax=unclassified Marinobacter TaxID=83889 RepID=UPI00387ADFB4
MVTEPLEFHLPAPPLRPLVSHYWRSRGNTDPDYAVIPDGAVDLVLQVEGPRLRALVYGTSTACRRVPLVTGGDYLGVRFRPARARHLLQAATHELTDTSEPVHDVLRLDLGDVPEIMDQDTVFDRLNQRLLAELGRMTLDITLADRAVACITAHCGQISIDALAEELGCSRRRLERGFLPAVGVPPKVFARICRFGHARDLLDGTGHELADVALQAGYYDQSHLSNEFRQFAGLSPSQYRISTD